VIDEGQNLYMLHKKSRLVLVARTFDTGVDSFRVQAAAPNT